MVNGFQKFALNSHNYFLQLKTRLISKVRKAIGYQRINTKILSTANKLFLPSNNASFRLELRFVMRLCSDKSYKFLSFYNRVGR